MHYLVVGMSSICVCLQVLFRTVLRCWSIEVGPVLRLRAPEVGLVLVVEGLANDWRAPLEVGSMSCRQLVVVVVAVFVLVVVVVVVVFRGSVHLVVSMSSICVCLQVLYRMVLRTT